MINLEEFAPKYATMALALWRDIENGTYPHNTALPPAPQLRNRFNTSIATVWKALELLARKGIVETRQGSGTYVIWTRNDADTTLMEGHAPNGRN